MPISNFDSPDPIKSIPSHKNSFDASNSLEKNYQEQIHHDKNDETSSSGWRSCYNIRPQQLLLPALLALLILLLCGMLVWAFAILWYSLPDPEQVDRLVERNLSLQGLTCNIFDPQYLSTGWFPITIVVGSIVVIIGLAFLVYRTCRQGADRCCAAICLCCGACAPADAAEKDD